LHYVFHKVFAQAILNFETFNGLSDLEIRAAMRNAAGPKPQLFVPEVAFESLVKKQIQKLEEPSLQCVHLVFEELKHIAAQSEVTEMQRFPCLRDRILEVAQAAIQRCVKPTNQMVMNLIHIELAHINVDHPDFIGGLRAMSAVQNQALEPGMTESRDTAYPGGTKPVQPFIADTERIAATPPPKATLTGAADTTRRQSGGRSQWWTAGQPSAPEPLRLPTVPSVVTPSVEVSEKEHQAVELLKTLISSYFAIVKRKIIDAVPKTVMHFMVNSVRDSLHHECISELYQVNLISGLLREGDDVKESRERSQKKLSELMRAQDILSQIRDSSMWQSR
jgi:dynamin 1-like protein